MKTVTTPIELRQPVRGLPDPGEKVPALAWPTVERLTVHHVLSRDDRAELTGRVTPVLVDRLVPSPHDVHAWFLCGPGEMVESMKSSIAAVADSSSTMARATRRAFNGGLKVPFSTSEVLKEPFSTPAARRGEPA